MSNRLYIPGATATGEQIAAAALRYVGTKYVWAGHNPRKGLDCIGLVDQAHFDVGLRPQQLYRDGVWPWTVDNLYGNALHGMVPLAEAQIGDTLVFGLAGKRVHVGIMTDVPRQLMISALVPRAAQTNIYAVRPEQLIAVVCSGLQVSGPVTQPVIPPPPSRTYTVQPGDTSLTQIARKLGTTWPRLYAKNLTVLTRGPGFVRAGMVLNV